MSSKTKQAAELSELEELRQTVAGMQATIQAMVAGAEEDGPQEPEFEMIRDPYSEHDAFTITDIIPPDDIYPEGQKLCWLSPALRERIGYRGWQPLEWGDKYTGPDGKLLEKYGLQAPPQIHEGTRKLDSYVRLGDAILCRLDKRLYDQRCRQINEKSEKQRIGARANQNIKVGSRGAVLTGPGLQDDPGRTEVGDTPMERGTISRVTMPMREDDNG